MHGIDCVFSTALETLNHLLDLVGGRLSPAGQGPYFVGNHRKTTAHLPGACSLDGRIQGQQVGLLGNAADHRQHLVDGCHLLRQIGNRLRGVADITRHLFDVRNRIADDFPCSDRLATRPLRGLCGVAGVACDLLHGQAHLVHGGGDHVGHFMLATRTGRGVVHHLGDLSHRAAQLLAGAQHITDQTAQATDEAVKATGQITQLISPTFIQTTGEVTTTATDFNKCIGHLTNRLHQPARQQHHETEEEQRDTGADQADGPQGAACLGEDFRFRHFTDQHPAQAFQWLSDRQKRLAIAFEAHRVGCAVEEFLRRFTTGQCGKLDLIVVLGFRMHLDATAAADQIYLSTLAEAKVADQFGHALQAEAKPSHPQGPTARLDALVDEQGGLARGLVDVDLEAPFGAAVDQAVKPAVAGSIAIEGA